MNSRLAASIYIFSAGICRRNTRNSVSSGSIVTSFIRRHCGTNRSFQAQGFESSSRVVHSSAIEDDIFSELGPEVSEYWAKPIKLVTEKPDCAVKNNPSRREVKRKPVSSRTRPHIKDIVATMGGDSPTSKSNLGSDSHVSTSIDDTKKISDVESPRFVLVKNIIPNVGLSELVEAISVFGKVSGASFACSTNGLRSCTIEFEDAQSNSRAILAGEITVGDQVFPVHSLDVVEIVAFKIENINKETTDYAIHTRCKTVGELVGLARKSNDVVEAFFNVRDDTNHLDILNKLNNTLIDHNSWSAHAITSKSNSSEVSSDDEARNKLAMQIVDQVTELKMQLTMKRLHLEDFEALITCIMHLKDFPTAIDLSGSK